MEYQKDIFWVYCHFFYINDLPQLVGTDYLVLQEITAYLKRKEMSREENFVTFSVSEFLFSSLRDF